MDMVDTMTYLDLKKKVGAIPVKLILAGLVTYFGIGAFGEGIKKYIYTAIMGMLIYTILSILWWFICATRNWIIGIIFAIAAFAGLSWLLSVKLAQYEIISLIVVLLLFFGGVALDVVRVIRLIHMRKKIKSGEC